jgi:hypothetical protein
MAAEYPSYSIPAFPFSQNQKRIEPQQGHQSNVGKDLVKRAFEGLLEGIKCDPHHEKDIPGNGKIFEQGKERRFLQH